MNILEDKLKSYIASGTTAMHMPGHKRNPDFCPEGFDSDITEIHGFDNLHNPTGIIKDVETSAADLWGADKAILSVNGATAPILASMMAVSNLGKVLIAANCHISVWHALELSNCEFEVINPVISPLPFCLEINPEEISKKLDEDDTIKSVIITSPTYEGVVSDIEAISRICHNHQVALIVDEAHGSHFGLNDYFPQTSQADIVIKSIHKTLHAPTQTAVLLTYSDKISIKNIRHYMDIVETSSPSYILMSGISRVVGDLREDKNLTSNWVTALKECRNNLRLNLKHVKLFECDNLDPSKLVILTEGVIDGSELSNRLHKCHIETEASFPTHIIAMTGIGDTKKSLETFAKALLDIDSKLTGNINLSGKNMIPTDKVQMNISIKDAVMAESISISKEQAIGKVSSKYAYRYPPGIPILIPGQLITKERVTCLPDEVCEVVTG